MVERSTIVEHLAQAERHVAQGAEHVAKQRGIVDQLARGGHDTAQAMALLEQFNKCKRCMSPTGIAFFGTLRKSQSDRHCRTWSACDVMGLGVAIVNFRAVLGSR
jgi:hypothetical protein